MTQTLETPAKAIRARIIVDYATTAGYEGIVCFSCGNASAALRTASMGLLPVLDVSPAGDLEPRRWWTPAEIARTWPRWFDGTSGHLPAHLIADIGAALRAHLGHLDPHTTYLVPTGSGETITALSVAYPGHTFAALYGTEPATRRELRAPMNPYVDRLTLDLARRRAAEARALVQR